MSNTRRTKSVQFGRNLRSPLHPQLNLANSGIRLAGVWGILAIGALSLLIRLVWLQIFDAPNLQQKAQRQQSVTVQPFVPRRPIVDRNGTQMAIDRPSFTLYAHPILFGRVMPKTGVKQQVTAAEIADLLAPILVADSPEATLRERDRLLHEFQQRKSGIGLGSGLREDVKDRVKALKLDGLEVIQGDGDYTRFYPQDDMAAEILGYLDGEHKAQAGIEYSQSLLLERKVAKYNLTQTKNESILPDRVTPDFLHTDDLQLKLTLDLRLQRAARQALRDKMKEWNALRGTVIVMDADTGALRSLVVEPTYDPNHYGRDVAKAKSTALLKNWAVSDLYEPGSTFKPLNVAIALENGVIKPSTTFYDGGAIKVGISTIRNSDKKGNGTIDIAEILQHSSNVGMVQMMQRLKPDVYYNWLQRIGLGQTSGIDLPFEARGEVRNRKEFIATPIDPATTAFGQGFSLTPIQLVTLIGSLANGGKQVTPHVIEGLFDSKGLRKDKPTQREPSQIFAPTTAQAVLDMMETVVTKGSGKKAIIPGYRIGGKTGTAQKAGTGGYTQDSKKITSFVGILPVDGQHRYVVFAAVDEPKGKEKAFGSNVAAPIVKTVMESLIPIERIPPSSSVEEPKPKQ
jgi:cell division protein FtsI (penicillin-binding protein 3)